LLSSQIHQGYVFHAEFSQDSKNVVSCSSEMELKVRVYVCVVEMFVE